LEEGTKPKKMEGFSYSNIFDTKGIEYLAIIAFLLLLIPFALILNKQGRKARQNRKVAGILSANNLLIPQGLFYSKNHTWTHLEKSGTAKVGLDDLLLHITGFVKLSHAKKPGDFISKGDLLTEIDHQGKLLQVYSPISGKILKENPLLSENPEMLYEDSCGKGWIFQIKPSNWMADTNSCLFGEEATGWLKNEIARYKDFLSGNMKKYSPEPSLVILQDGGEISENSLSELPNEIWKDFQRAFLNPDI